MHPGLIAHRDTIVASNFEGFIHVRLFDGVALVYSSLPSEVFSLGPRCRYSPANAHATSGSNMRSIANAIRVASPGGVLDNIRVYAFLSCVRYVPNG
jgi:hypothetical protein